MREPHIPERTCIGCHTKRPKRDLLRVVANDGKVIVDDRQRLPGRGAYFCHSERCWQAGVKRGLNRALRATIPAATRQELPRAFTMRNEITNG